ncbi:MAG: hypothetical protein AB7K64_18630 [Variibacter sp.]
MRDLALQAAGVLAVLVALAHGSLAEWRVFPNAQIAPRGARRLLRMVWQASTVDWIAVGVLLIAAPALGSEAARRAIVALAVVVYGYGAIGSDARSAFRLGPDGRRRRAGAAGIVSS